MLVIIIYQGLEEMKEAFKSGVATVFCSFSFFYFSWFLSCFCVD
jgi:hypothetical protein